MALFDKQGMRELARMLKFGITGVANTLVDYVLFLFLAQVCGLNPYASQVCSYSAGMLNSYLLNRSWTFKSKERFFGGQMVRFVVTNLVVLGLSMALLYLFGERLGLAVWLAKLLATGVCMVVNFIISRFWVFTT